MSQKILWLISIGAISIIGCSYKDASLSKQIRNDLLSRTNINLQERFITFSSKNQTVASVWIRQKPSKHQIDYIAEVIVESGDLEPEFFYQDKLIKKVPAKHHCSTQWSQCYKLQFPLHPNTIITIKIDLKNHSPQMVTFYPKAKYLYDPEGRHLIF